MNTRTVTVTETARNFSDYVNRVTYRRERFVLYKGRKAVAELRPTAVGRRLGELPEIIAGLPSLAKDDAGAFAAEVRRNRAKASKERLRNPWVS